MPTPEEKVTEAIEERKEGFGEPEAPDAETTDTDDKPTDTEAVEDPSPSEETTETDDDGESKVADAVEETEEAAEPEPKKSGVQKRIDRLTAEKHELAERVKALEGKAEKDAPKERVYNDAELDRAEKKAIDEGDMSLLAEVGRERRKNDKRELIDMYKKEKATQTQASTALTQEWNDIVESYSDDDPDMDIRNKEGKLFRTAKEYYDDAELSRLYKGKGGMARAVADAFRELVKLSKKKKSKSPGEKKLERKLAKAKSKTALSDVGSEVAEKKLKPKESTNPVKDFIAERNAIKSKASGRESF